MSVRTAASASARVGRSGRVAAAEWPRERLLLTTLSIRVLRPPARQASYARLSGGNVNKPATFAPTTPGARKGYATFIAQTPRQASNENRAPTAADSGHAGLRAERDGTMRPRATLRKPAIVTRRVLSLVVRAAAITSMSFGI